MQRRLEEVLLELARWLHRRTGDDDLVLAGGVALNCVANSRLWREGPFARVWVQPASGDSGTALGAALQVAHELGDRVRADAHRGARAAGWDDDGARRGAVDGRRRRSSEPDDIADAVAEVLADDGVVAWFQGRSEFGPRALGHRSLLADPRRPENLEKLNDIKGREQFRPVAPMVLAERAAEIFRDGADPVAVHALHARRARTRGASASRPSCTSTGPRASRPSTAPTSRWWRGCSSASRRAPACPVVVNTSLEHRRAGRWSTTRATRWSASAPAPVDAAGDRPVPSLRRSRRGARAERAHEAVA